MTHMRIRPFGPVLFVLALAVAGCDAAAPGQQAASSAPTADGRPGWGGPDTPPLAEVVLMSQNLYLGGDLNVVAAEPNPQMIPVRVAQLYGTIVASVPAERMAAIADEIARVRPALVGLQEVSTYYVQIPGDNLPGMPSTPATQVTYDFLDLLLDALADRGLVYEVASRNDNSDVEFPATTDGQSFFDVRYQDADVVLALDDPDVVTGASADASFQALLTIPVGGQPVTFVRGWQWVDATVDGQGFRFFNTHLETAAAPPIQIAQGDELKALIDGTSGPVVLAGDLNSDADGGSTPVYATITQSLTDVFARPPQSASPTCCQAADLRNATSEHTERIDFLLYRGFDSVRRTETVLDDSRTSTTAGLLWASDHAGVAALLIHNLRRARPV
jgi:endonuclease/exonuclease/phosphatase family metal-dependent hydrolase